MTFHKGNVRQWHYDHCRAVCHPALVTTPSFQCDYCLEWFPKLDMQKQHECPAKLPLGRLHKIATENVEQQGFGASLVTPHERYIYTDGSGGNADQGAGSAVLFRHVVTRYVIPDYILFGPVVTHCWDPNFLGAERGTNNTVELTAIGEACLWLLERSDERSGDPDDPQSLAVVLAYIYYDSEYARNMATRDSAPSQNVELANKVADLVDQVRLHRPLWFRHVKGHSRMMWEICADFFAGEGAKGFSSPQWSATPASWVDIQNRDPSLVEVCSEFGRHFDTALARGTHEGKCKAVGVGLAEGRGRCRKCGKELAKRSVRTHEKTCRGDVESNRKCQYYCGCEIEDMRLLKAHEFDCKRLVDCWEAAAARGPLVVPPPLMSEQDGGLGQCSKCGFQTKPGYLQAHMRRRRGSELLNRTCQKCGRENASYDSVRSHECICRV